MKSVERTALHMSRPAARPRIGFVRLIAYSAIAWVIGIDPALAQSAPPKMNLDETIERAASIVQTQDCQGAARQIKRAQDYVKANAVNNQLSRQQMGFVLKDIALCYFGAGQKAQGEQAGADAIALFQSSLRGNVMDASSYNGMGDIYLLRKEYDDAINEYGLAIRLVPDYTFAWHDLVLALSSKYKDAGKADSETLSRLLRALDRLEELQRTAPQKVPADHWEGIKQIKTWALAESAKLTTSKK